MARNWCYRKNEILILQKPLLATVRTADPGKPAAGVAAVQVALDYLLDDRPEVAVLALETVLVLDQDPFEVMEEHPVENGTFWMAGTVESWHSSRYKSRNGPIPSRKG